MICRFVKSKLYYSLMPVLSIIVCCIVVYTIVCLYCTVCFIKCLYCSLFVCLFVCLLYHIIVNMSQVRLSSST